MSHAIQSIPLEPDIFDPVRLAVAGYLARFSGATLISYEADMRFYLAWCYEHGLAPLEARRPHLELYVRDIEQRLAPATVCRRIGTIAGFYKICVQDGILPMSPAQYIRRPKVPTTSQTLGLSHLEFEAILVAARARPMDHALVVLMGLLGLRVSTACAVDVENIGYSGGHRTITVASKGGHQLVKPMPPMVARAIDEARGDRLTGPLLLSRAGTRMSRQVASKMVTRLTKKAGIGHHLSPHGLRHTFVTTMLDAGVDLRDVQIAADHAKPETTVRYDRARTNLDRSGIYRLSTFMAGAG